ncbi:MAG: PIN domain-containing protein [Gammaproteobacteria bacterium]|nr:PIN domain-containing protein [Gammaproteobacteria bacterium]
MKLVAYLLSLVMDNKIIVVDTSVIISALISSSGSNRQILRKCLLGEYLPLISNTLFLEYEDVSKREKVLNSSPLNSSHKCITS